MLPSPAVLRRRRVAPLVLAGVLLGTRGVLAAWKHNSLAAERAAVQPEPVEVVTVAVATPRTHQETTTAIGTVLALESITLRSEVPGTVRHVSPTPGAIVEAGTVLVALDSSVEAAEPARSRRRPLWPRPRCAATCTSGNSRPPRRPRWIRLALRETSPGRRWSGSRPPSPRRSSGHLAPGSVWPTSTAVST